MATPSGSAPASTEETVRVQTERLTINGANAGRDATRAGRRRESIVTSDDPAGAVQLLADHITWDGFTIRGVTGEENGPGMLTSRDHSGYLIRDTIFEDNGVGLRLGSNGAHPTLVCRNRFVANNEFADGGYGIFSDEGARQVLITYEQVRAPQRRRDLLRRPGPRATEQRDILIDHNKSVDDMSFATIYDSSRVRLISNNVRARVGDPRVPGPGLGDLHRRPQRRRARPKNKVKSASGNGIDVTNTGEPGTGPAAPTNVVVRKNKVSHAKLTGLHFGPGTTGPSRPEPGPGQRPRLPGCLPRRDRHRRHLEHLAGNVGATDKPGGICRPTRGRPRRPRQGSRQAAQEEAEASTARTRAPASGTQRRSDRGHS